ncbi:MAG: tetratricopeptide repeat protein, partial [Chloroflexi bacterium]|nr:tetratricopeptide repeat protein [Chloroflexota bacterium]
ESLAAKHGAKPEELVTDPNKRSEKPPEWVSQAQNIGQEAPVPQAPVTSTSSVSINIENLGASAQEQDDAVAWLESLAAKHGAKPEELVTDPNKRSETPPEWVSQAQSIGEAQPAQPEQKPEVVENALNIGEQFFAEFENALTAAPITPAADETSAWLQDLAAEEEKQVQPSSEIPDWLSGNQPSQAAGEQFESAEQQAETEKSDLPDRLSDIEEKDANSQGELVSENVPQGDLANWLNSLDDEPGLPFESLPTPDSILFESQSATKSKGREPAGQKSDLPDWLSGVESAEIEAEDEWKPPTATQAEAESLPAWLQEEAEEEESAPAYSEDDDDTPPWQHRERWEAEEPQEAQEVQEPQYPTPTSPSDWHPLEAKQAPAKPVATPEQKAFVPPPPLPATMQQPPAAPEPAVPAKKKLALPARKQPEPANAIVALNQAKGELDRGDIPAALAHYGKLIKKGKHIEETIRDLTESIYRYPVEVGIWQTLGDAYMRANRLKEALEAYNKAEELIR